MPDPHLSLPALLFLGLPILKDDDESRRILYGDPTKKGPQGVIRYEEWRPFPQPSKRPKDG